MARIYIGRATGIGSFERYVVLKVILPERANDETSVQMFLDEARLAASLNHQNVAQVFEVGEDGGIHFLAMEYVHGQDLRALLARAGAEGTRVPLELALTVVAGAAAGLDHAHERRTSDGVPMGIVHRDVSPSNIMIGYDGAVKLLDFGIAKATSRSVETQSGIIKGKFAYMAPEQCRGRDVDRRSDVFSLGIILYEVTTQHRCFRADNDFDTMHRIVTGDVVKPTRLVQGYPQALEAIVMKALEIDPQRRYQSAGLLLEAVESFALAARVPLSTMALGRFMRDLFGDVQEPWLAAGRIDTPAPREQTISSTNASGRHPGLPPHHEEAPLHLPPDSPMLDLSSDLAHGGPGVAVGQAAMTGLPAEPRGYSDGAGAYSHSDGAGAYSQSDGAGAYSQSDGAAAYPAIPPLYPEAMPAADVAPDRHPSSPSLPPMLAQVAPPLTPGSQPIPPLSFAVPGADPGPFGAHPLGSQPIASTRRGYDGAPSHSELSYPRYDPAQDPDLDVNLQPSNRLLYIGFGIAVVGIIVLLSISIGDNDDLSPPPRTAPVATTRSPDPVASPIAVPDEPAPAPVKPAGGSAAVAATEPLRGPTAAPVDAGAPAVVPVVPVVDDAIGLHVTSVPSGADVYLGDKAIGV
ncbi:MAG TPA: protein kinase, partial [Kofleriaceae bacterium]|nr:protein kinase [Kofleriaceae bacterium]